MKIRNPLFVMGSFAVAGVQLLSVAVAQTNQNSSNLPVTVLNVESASDANQPYESTFVPSNSYVDDGIIASAWYAIPAIREQLNLTDGQLDQLDQFYGQAWTRYNQGLYALAENLEEPERIQRQQDLTGMFRRNLINATDHIFSDPAARARFNQLFLQYRWYAAFTDQFVQQQLNLTEAQRQAFRLFDQEWSQQMALGYEEYPLNRIAVTQMFELSRRDFEDNVYAVLGKQQWQLWQTMIGERFNFTPEDYFLYWPNSGGTTVASSRMLEPSSDTMGSGADFPDLEGP